VRQDERVISALKLRMHLLWWAPVVTAFAAVSLVLFVLTVAGSALIVVWVGIPLLLAALAAARPLAQFYRRRLTYIDGKGVIDSPYLTSPHGNLLVRVLALFRDPARRRDAVWLLVNGTVGLALGIIGIVESVLDLIFWWLPPGLAVRVHAALSRALLSVSEKSRLALRVEQLTESRAETVDTQAAELRRIERDLHDGAQARLVAIGMSLGLAEKQLERDPDLARSLLVEARDTAGDALADLRELVRGIHPPVLADRGLVEAIRALASAVPVPVAVRADIPGRLPAPVESAAYFAAAEVLTNVVKHASAKQVTIVLKRVGNDVELVVEDDGIGGADVEQGTGLQGIARRLSAFDGVLTVESPAGGPTKVVMVLPCVWSSAKTLPSSGKA
jgi:signal transduction histidine kinase